MGGLLRERDAGWNAYVGLTPGSMRVKMVLIICLFSKPDRCLNSPLPGHNTWCRHKVLIWSQPRPRKVSTTATFSDPEEPPLHPDITHWVRQ